MRRVSHLTIIAAAVVIAGACSSEPKAPEGTTATPPAPTPSTQPASDVKATGKVIEVELITDEKGNYFKPSKFEVHRGDLIRFKLVAGVHNVHFLPDSNPGRSNLPPASDLLQLPGQTLDVPLTFGEGTFYFQCDPHAALGMKGHVKVED